MCFNYNTLHTSFLINPVYLLITLPRSSIDFLYLSRVLIASKKTSTMRYLLLAALTLMILSCETSQKTKLKNGDYRATINVGGGKELPFNFKLKEDGNMEMYNAEEIIDAEEILYFNDSVRINFEVYEGYISGKLVDGNLLGGKYIKESLDRVVSVKFEHGRTDRFLDLKPTDQNITGIWEMIFTEEDGSTFKGKGIFEQQGNEMTGTIRTTTGDYRYLEGAVSGKDLKLSVFDGAHAFLFTANVDGDKIDNGTFHSGDHYQAKFSAIRNPNFELPNEDSLTYLKEGYDKFDFSFPNLDDEITSLSDDRFNNKVVVVQIFGSWCPNCLDESRYYSAYYNHNNHPDLEFVALAFEYAKTKESAIKGLKRLKENIGIEYPILLAQFGSSDKAEAQKKVPMLNHVLSYPTTIIIDKTGEVRKIHTGFNGPATRQKYSDFKIEFESFLDELLAE